jgi:2-dehydro-3-deoxy-D-arabinonate dehydratase
MKLFRTKDGPVVGVGGKFLRLTGIAWDQLLARDDIRQYLQGRIAAGELAAADEPAAPLAPVEGQEVWAAGVTYLRSREARREESK